MSEPTKVLTNEYLKGIMTDAMVDRGFFGNIDELLTPGIYVGGANTSSGTFPDNIHSWQYGTLEVIVSRPPRVIQRIIAEDGAVATRVWQPPKWTAWKILTS